MDSNLISKIQEACDWVTAKKLRPSEGITTEVKFVNWEKKLFSPAFAVIWKSTSTGLQSMIPPTEQWLTILAEALGTNITWAWNFTNACYYSTNTQSSIEFSGEILDSGKIRIKYSPKTNTIVHDKSVLEIAKIFIDKYPAPVKPTVDFNPIHHKNDHKLITESILNKLSSSLLEYYRLTEGE